MNWQNKIAIADYGTMAFLFAIGIIACIRAHQQYGLSSDAQRLIRGIGLICVWGVMHQSFWFSRWYLYANGDTRTEWFLENSYLLMLPYTLAFIGAIKVAYALFRSRCFVYNTTEIRIPWIKGWNFWVVSVIALWISVYLVIP